MDRKNRRTENIDKKNDCKKKDRGDLKLPLKSTDERIKSDEIVTSKIINPYGDTHEVTVNQRPEFKINVTIKPTSHPNKDDSKLRNSEVEKFIENKRNIKVIQNEKKTAVDLKSIREKYTMKLRNPTRSGRPLKKIDLIDKMQTEILKIPMENFKKESKEFPSTKDQETVDDLPVIGDTTPRKNYQRRKPDLKIKNVPTRLYKAVTFEEKNVKQTTLEKNMPKDTCYKLNSIKISDLDSLKSKQTVSKASIKEKTMISKKFSKKCGRKHRNSPSRDRLSPRRSPQTEVAKWAPASITTHTKPYYEAWVDTTSTAISNSDRLRFEKKALMRYLQKALERPSTPELYYSNCSDEKYIGKIKITHQK